MKILWAVNLALILSACGVAANLQTQSVFQEHCQKPSGSDVDSFLGKFALDDNRAIMFGNPTPLQLANSSNADDQDRQAIAKLSRARENCFRRLEAVNPDPLGPTYYNVVNMILARLYNREMTFGQANQMAASVTSEILARKREIEAARQAQWASVSAMGAAIYLTSLQNTVQTNSITTLNCNTAALGTTRNTRCVIN